MSRFCKTCRYLRRIETRTPDDRPLTLYRCGYSVTIPAPWPIDEYTYKPDSSISPRHIVPGDHYPDTLGSTADWTEVMDCPTWAPVSP